MQRFRRPDGAIVFGLFLFAALVLLAGNLGFSLWEPWEPKNARTAVEMWERKDFLTPFFRGDPRFSKPPLMFWLMAPVYAGFGASEFALRLPFVLVAVGGLGTFVYGLRRLLGARAAYLSGWVLLTSPMFFFLARQLMPDVLLVSFLMACLSLVALAIFSEERRTLHMGLAYVFAALAVLAKGPLALFLIASVLGLYAVAAVLANPTVLRTPLQSSGRFAFGTLKLHWGLPLLLALSLPWYVYNIIHYDIFLERLEFDYLHRVAAPEGNHDGGLFYYAEALTYGTFPWICLVPAAIVVVGARIKESWGADPRPLLFLVAWFLGPFLLFTVSATKFTHYIAPALPPLAAIVGLLLDRYLSGRDRHRWIAVLAVLSLALFITPAYELIENARELIGSFTIKVAVTPIVEADPAVRSPRDLLLGASLLWGAALFACALLTEARWRRWVTGALVLVAFGLGVYEAQGLMVSLSPHKSQEFTTGRVLVLKNPADPVCVADPGAAVRHVLEWAAIEASVVFYADNDVLELTSVDDAITYFAEHAGAYCIARTEHLGQLRAKLRAEAYMGLDLIDDSHYRFQVVRVVPLP